MVWGEGTAAIIVGGELCTLPVQHPGGLHTAGAVVHELQSAHGSRTTTGISILVTTLFL
jgi:hypothetical protein